MTHVTLFIQEHEQKFWHSLEDVAQTSPIFSKRVLPFAMATGYFAKEILKNPLMAIENVITIGARVKDYCLEKDSQRAYWINNGIQSLILQLVINLFMTAFYPVFALVNSIRLGIQMFKSPIKTAKIHASKQDLIAFLREEKVFIQKGYSNGKLDTIACEYKYAKHAFKHFRIKVQKANDSDVPSMHFADTLASRNALVNEINSKTAHFDNTFKVYIQNMPQDKKLHEAYLKQWMQYQRDLLNAENETLGSVKFTYSLA